MSNSAMNPREEETRPVANDDNYVSDVLKEENELSHRDAIIERSLQNHEKVRAIQAAWQARSKVDPELKKRLIKIAEELRKERKERIKKFRERVKESSSSNNPIACE